MNQSEDITAVPTINPVRQHVSNRAEKIVIVERSNIEHHAYDLV